MKKLYLATAAIIASIPAVFASSDSEPVAVIKGPNGYPVRISATQFDPKQHKLHEADEHHDADGVARYNRGAANDDPSLAPPIDPTVTPIPPVVVPVVVRQFGVLQNNKKFFIVDTNGGATVTDVAAFDAKGYPDNASAWAAITAAALTPASDNGGAAT